MRHIDQAKPPKDIPFATATSDQQHDVHIDTSSSSSSGTDMSNQGNSSSHAQRLLTFVYYFNTHPNGGELRVYKPANLIVDQSLSFKSQSASCTRTESLDLTCSDVSVPMDGGRSVIEYEEYIDISPKHDRLVVFRRYTYVTNCYICRFQFIDLYYITICCLQ